MVYNIWFNVSALFILTALLFFYYIKYSAPIVKYRFFLGMLWTATISTICSILNNTLPGIVPNWILIITNLSYFLSHTLILPLLLLYLRTLVDVNFTEWKKAIPWMVPTVFSLVLIIVCSLNQTLFTIDANGVYERGRFMPVLYVMVGLNFFLILIHLIYLSKIIYKSEWICILFFVLISFSSVIIQLIYPEYLVENFASAFCLMISQLSIQKPEQIMYGDTGVLNKKALEYVIEPRILAKKRFDSLFIVLDNYDEIEKQYGYKTAEKVLKILTDSLYKYKGIILTRIGLYKFIAIFDKDYEIDFKDEYYNAIHSRMNSVFEIEDENIILKSKYGILNYPEQFTSLEDLTDTLNIIERYPHDSIYGGYYLNESIISKLKRVKLIDSILKDKDLVSKLNVVYQPIYCYKKNTYCGAEALIRLSDPLLGAIGPDEFIPIAESNGTINKISEFVLDHVCKLIEAHPLDRKRLAYIDINMTFNDLIDPSFADSVIKSIDKYGIDPNSIIIEITETAFSAKTDIVDININKLNKKGVRISLDDYGTGYSNLKRLSTTKFDIVKIDKSIVQEASINESAELALKNTLKMLKVLDMKILLEGIETEAQSQYAKSHGANYAQGYYFSMPISEDKFIKLCERINSEEACDDDCRE